MGALAVACAFACACAQQRHVDAERVGSGVRVSAPLLPVSAPPNATLPPLPGGSPRTVAPVPGATATAAGPRIDSVSVTPKIVHDGDTVRWDVHTSSDVTDVSAKVKLYAFRLQRLSPGRFLLAFTIPHGVPGFFHGTYDMDLEARDAAGTVVSRTVPVDFQ